MTFFTCQRPWSTSIERLFKRAPGGAVMLACYAAGLRLSCYGLLSGIIAKNDGKARPILACSGLTK